MKLQKLVITGFGPYALRQELDFEKNLQGKNMFVITGNTGAGKTTIFDAINFALYGEASGSDRESKSLRSDFAEPQTPTEVELWFSLRNKEYYVKRSPAYTKPKQRGEGFIESKPTAEIRLSKDKTMTGPTQVTKEIENILGITTEQFKQLVMIPQGEFKKLLNAKSEEKEDIFRKIFGTEIFQSIQYKIKEQANKLERGIREVQRDRLNKIKSFNCKEEDENLFRLINAEDPNVEMLMKKFYEFVEEDKEQQKVVMQKVNELDIVMDKMSNEIALGDATNKKFNNLEKSKEELDKLVEQIKEYANKKLQLDRGRKTLTVKWYEDRYSEKKHEWDNLNAQIKAIEKKIEEYKGSFEKAEGKFKLEQNREEEKNKLVNAISENQRLIGKASNYEINKSNVEILDKKVKEIKYRIQEIAQIDLKNDEKLEVINKNLEDINKAKEEKGKLEIKQLAWNTKKEKIYMLKNAIEKRDKSGKIYEETKKNFGDLEQRFLEARNKYELLDDIFRKSQAGLLAVGLEEGTACKVCGATHHPNLAKLANSEISEEAIKKSKEFLEKIRESRDKKLEELTIINSSLKYIKENTIDPFAKELLLEDVSDISVQVDRLVKNSETILLELKDSIRNLTNIIDKESENINERGKLKNSSDKLRQELELKNVVLVDEEGKLSAARNTLEMIKNEFKGEIKTVSELEKTISFSSNSLLRIKNAYEKAEKEFNSSKSLFDQEAGNFRSTKQMKENADKELNTAKAVFKEKVMGLGFIDYTDYKSSSLTEEKINLLDKEINEFQIQLAGVRQTYKDSLKEIQGLSRMDLTILQDKLSSENIVKKALSSEVNEVYSRITTNVLIIENCKKYSEAIENDENKYKTVGKLSNILNGDNTKKISFERYVLASYFEDIIEASNIRFSKMTAGRFELLRKQDMGDKRKGQGLDLEVFDNYTGKARDVKTLSGGEGFKASLSMALGLADIVQAHAGGIQLDTMFIDEGFGTLDPESLDNAIECLMDLQNDARLVGIISHVPELKERIDARLEVTSTNRGSMAEFKV